MSDWKPFLFEGATRVFVEVDEEGVPLLKKGLAKMVYRLGSERTYSARPSKLSAAGAPPAESESRFPEQDWIRVFTDGACLGNPGPAGCAALVLEGKKATELSRYLGQGTNNIAELEAIRLGLLAVKDRTRPVRVFTDSGYALGLLSLGWKAKANQQLVQEIRLLLRAFPTLEFVKVRGHAGVPENERVDELAREAIENGRR